MVIAEKILDGMTVQKIEHEIKGNDEQLLCLCQKI